MSGVGRGIAKRRKSLGLTQRPLGVPGVSYAYIGRIEKGTRTPSLSALAQIAAKLDTTALWLLTGREAAVGPFCGRGPTEHAREKPDSRPSSQDEEPASLGQKPRRALSL
jgi:transcriptional regulator with XRE-family HTH domain